MMNKPMIGNAQVLYNDKTDILSIRNLIVRSRCTKTENGLHNIVKRYDISNSACGFDIEEATYLFRNDLNFLSDFSYEKVKQQHQWT